jgi:hypothetical protein
MSSNLNLTVNDDSKMEVEEIISKDMPQPEISTEAKLVGKRQEIKHVILTTNVITNI